MQKLIQLVEQLKQNRQPEQLLINTIREYLQVLILELIYHSKESSSLSFMGGTALRICYNLKRFSEGLDFCLDIPSPDYSFPLLIKGIVANLNAQNYDAHASVQSEKTVQKAFIKFPKILHPLGLTQRKDQKIHIKIEVDLNPIKIGKNQMESFFVTKFDMIFPILKHKMETLFAGKIFAIIARKYTKGRDYYDLIWYLTKKTGIDMEYLNAAAAILEIPNFKNEEAVFHYLDKIIGKVHPEIILKDVGRFLEDPKEEEWLKNYQAIFKQLSQ